MERRAARTPLPGRDARRVVTLCAGGPSSAWQPRSDAVGDGIPARPRPGLVDLTRQRATHHGLDVTGDREQAVQIDAGLDAHRVEAVDEVLGADVAGGAG